MFGGQNKTGFGASATGTGTGSMFGGGNTGGTGFGSGTGGGFGASNTAGGFGTAAAATTNNGTATVPFNAFQEKDTAASGGTQHFQTITFQDPYKNFSLEELRTVDYNQGRRYGNQNGQPGAFGQSTGFGGFSANNNTTTGAFGSNSNTSSGLFGGGNNNTASAFGQNNTTSAFGNNTNTAGNGLFAQNKPAGGLFGSTPATQPSTGGLFGSTTNTNTGGTFGTGSAGFGASTTGGGMFGQANQTQNKPAFGGFGSGTTTTNTGGSLFGGSTGGGFGTNTSSNTGGGMFGQANQAAPAPGFGANQTATNTGSGLFGGANTGNGLFGQGQQNQNQPQQSGGLFGGAGSFGQSSQQNQPKPGGLFGNSTTNTTSGGLFGQNNQSQQAGGSFGNTVPQNQSGGLFGNKPAAPSTGLFGNTAQNTGTTGGGLFGGIGSQTNQQNQGSTLFGQNQQKPGGLFGNSTANTNTGNGLFSNLGQSNNNASAFGGSLFSSQNQQPQNQQSAGNSLFGASGGSSLLQTSMNTNPYGNDALFANLATPAQSPGPLATPLSSSQKNRKSAILPQHKLNPAASTRLLTPQTKRVGGYGFTYSTYGTPNSASTGSSPGFSGGLLGNSNLSKSLGRSVSNSSLRNSFSAENSILAPGAFTSTGRAHGTGSMKKLNINRNINTRMPLFEDVPDKKRVSFAGTPNGSDSGSTVSNPNSAVVLRSQAEEEPPAAETSSSRATVNGETTTPSQPEMSQVRSSELTSVPENGALTPRTSSSLNQQGSSVIDPAPGHYWSKPSMDQLRKMSRSELSNVENFVVGRDKIGRIEFNPGKSVDLSGVDLDKLYGDIVHLTVRNATVYGEHTTIPKPARGTGLNHFSRITLGNSWPRNRAGKRDPKHLERLKRVNGTTFVDYLPQSGEWIFTVPHFSSYGLDYDGEQYSDNEDDEEDDDDDSSELSAPPDTPAQLHSSQMTGTPEEDSNASPTQSSPDDTFDFMKGKRSRASVPGGYGDEVAYEENENVMDTNGSPFLGERSVGSLDGQHDADYSEESEFDPDQDQTMAESVSSPVQTTEQQVAKESDSFKETIRPPKSILKNSQILRPTSGTPLKNSLIFDDDWANQLQRTISPKKKDRHALRESQGNVLREPDANVPESSQFMNDQREFTRLDMMKSLFPEEPMDQTSSAKRAGSGIEV
jgi:nuclear pore complex protein Nup98-Nup96